MKPSCVLASVLVFVTCALTAPAASKTILHARNGNGTETTTGQTSSPMYTKYPSLQVLWNSKYTDLRYQDTITGHLLNSPSEQVNTAVYFNLGQESKGKTCKLVHRLSNDDALVTPGPSIPAVFDIYRLKNCLNVRYSWINRIERGALVGILTSKKGKWNDKIPVAANLQGVDMSADTTEPLMGTAPTWSCQPGEYSFEIVARPGVNIGWTIGRGSGLSIEIWG